METPGICLCRLRAMAAILFAAGGFKPRAGVSRVCQFSLQSLPQPRSYNELLNYA
uniref:Uncharacterized protein n=1 Tax=Anguilla anguilla TaxID=7936 RepID=A0A0E9R4N2_ANGAN